MTFDEARCQHLRDLDEIYLEVRAVVGDSSFVDGHNPVYRAAFQRLRDTIEKVRRVNQSAADLSEPTPTPEEDQHG